MNKHLLFHIAGAAFCTGAVTPGVSTAWSADAPPPSVAYTLPINLARGDLGTRLEARAPKVKNPESSTIVENASAQALISDDAALTYPLLPGKTSLIVTLSKIQVLNHFNFINFGAAGTYSIAVSSTKLGFDAPGWHDVIKAESFDNPQVVATDIGSVEGRYVKIDFDAQRSGRISGLGLFGAPTIGSFEKKPLGYAYISGSPGAPGGSPSEMRNVYFDLANLDAGARVVALSRGGDLDAAQAMLDGNAESSFLFDPTDPAPAVVVDLGVRRVINRLSCVYDAPPGRLDFYLVDNPYPRQARGATLSYVTDPGMQPIDNESGEYSGRNNSHGRQAIYSVDTSAQPGLNRLAADMSGQTGRFLVAEFHPLAVGSAPAGDFKDRDFKDRDFKDAGGNPSQPLRVLSLSAFGQSPSDQVTPLVPPPSGGGTGTPGNPGAITPIAPPSGGFVVTK
jgi:hypothetical protein